MLIMNVTIYQHLTNDRKDEEIYFDVHVGWNVDRKERKKVKMLIQNKRALVPKKSVWEKKRALP